MTNSLSLTEGAQVQFEGTFDRTNETASLRPTVEAYEGLEQAFDFFDLHVFAPIFGVSLPHVMLTMPRSERFQGYFWHDSWNSTRTRQQRASEIALNPQCFGSQREVCQTLVHEMVHLAQAERPEIFGRPSPRGYHNLAFARAMVAVGLMPSSTGSPGGKTTGYSMGDYVIDGGPFERAYDHFVRDGHGIRWASATSLGLVRIAGADDAHPLESDRERKRRSKTRFSCIVCGLNAWAKPSARLICGDCAAPMQEVAR